METIRKKTVCALAEVLAYPETNMEVCAECQVIQLLPWSFRNRWAIKLGSRL